jgi:hypothetical protein
MTAGVSVFPRMLLGAVNGVEIVAVGALQFARDVLVSAVSGAANIGAEAVSATVIGARGVVSATSTMVGDIAGTAQSAVQAALHDARRPRPGSSRGALRRPLAPPTGDANDTTAPAAASSRKRGRRQRTAA